MLKWKPEWEMPPNDPMNAWTEYLPSDPHVPSMHGNMQRSIEVEDRKEGDPRGLLGTIKIIAAPDGHARLRAKAECHSTKGFTLYYYPLYIERVGIKCFKDVNLIYVKGERVCSDFMFNKLPALVRGLKNWAAWRYPNGIYPGRRKAKAEFAEFYPREKVHKAMKQAWNDNKMRWQLPVKVPYEFWTAEEYFDWLIHAGPFAYAHNEEKLVKRFDEFEELTGEPLPDKEKIVAQALATCRMSTKIREEYFKTQKKL